MTRRRRDANQYHAVLCDFFAVFNEQYHLNELYTDSRQTDCPGVRIRARASASSRLTPIQRSVRLTIALVQVTSVKEDAMKLSKYIDNDAGIHTTPYHTILGRRGLYFPRITLRPIKMAQCASPVGIGRKNGECRWCAATATFTVSACV